MKFFFSILLLILSSLIVNAENDHSLRLLTYNIHAGIGTDKQFDLERIAEVIKNTDPHVVALQEVDKETRRSQGIDIAKRLGELTGMTPVFGPSIPFSGGEYGNAILTTLSIEKSETLAIPEIIPIEKRSVLIADLKFKDTVIQILATHLCHREETNRVAAAKFLQTLQASKNKTSFLMGDLNALPSSEPLSIITSAGWQKPSPTPLFTSPALEPKRQIDYILYRPSSSTKMNVRQVLVLDEKVASDHRPLLLVLDTQDG